MGCGNGNAVDWVRKLNLNIEYIGIDIENSPEVASRTREDAKFITYDGVHLPFETNSVDIIYSSQVFEHVREPHLLIPEIARCLNDNGLFIGSVSQMEPYHSYSTFNYTFFGIYWVFQQYGLTLLKLRPGIDAITLINRNLKKFILKEKDIFEDYFWNTESPINYLINTFAARQKFSIWRQNFEKIKMSGHLCFVAKKTL